MKLLAAATIFALLCFSCKEKNPHGHEHTQVDKASAHI